MRAEYWPQQGASSTTNVTIALCVMFLAASWGWGDPCRETEPPEALPGTVRGGRGGFVREPRTPDPHQAFWTPTLSSRGITESHFVPLQSDCAGPFQLGYYFLSEQEVTLLSEQALSPLLPHLSFVLGSVVSHYLKMLWEFKSDSVEFL